MKILKFGGSSVGSPKAIEKVKDILQSKVQDGEHLGVVVSAFKGVTDSLIDISQKASRKDTTYQGDITSLYGHKRAIIEDLITDDLRNQAINFLDEAYQDIHQLLNGMFLLGEFTPKAYDRIVSYGEKISAKTISLYLEQEGLISAYLDASTLVKTNNEHTSAKVDFETTNRKIQEFGFESSETVYVITGFIGSDETGAITTLGRGGSDYTAAIFAAAIQGVDELEIWTDVNGVLTSNPRFVKQAYTIPTLSYSEAVELSNFGAKVIYPPTIMPAMKKGIPVYIKNTFEADHPGTKISDNSSTLNKSPIKGISSLDNISLIRIQGTGMVGVHGIAARMFSCLANHSINIIMIVQASSEHSICIAIDSNQAEKARNVLQQQFKLEIHESWIDGIHVENQLKIIAVIGEGMRKVPGIAGRLFKALGTNGVNVIAIAQGSSELNISLVVEEKDEAKALNVIHDSFFLSEQKSVHLFMIGVGLIGSTLLEQLKQQQMSIKERYNTNITVHGLANSRKMLIRSEGIPLSTWREHLDMDGIQSDPSLFLEKMIATDLANAIFIDNTASKEIPTLYDVVLENNISIATSNKVAASSPFEYYSKLKDLAYKKGVHFQYETNVGAGLPIISSLRNLINSGDDILGIQAILSGSLSFIFNHFDGSKPFSELVQEAKEKGFTEPDPREDLSGNDVVRKLVILARESGYQINMEDVAIKPILPDYLFDIDSVDEFMDKLKQEDNSFSKRIADAMYRKCKLRIVANWNPEKATVEVIEVDHTHPFYNLKGSDNIILIKTKRYFDNPLIISGPGAGAAVTAAGVFGDILGISNLL